MNIRRFFCAALFAATLWRMPAAVAQSADAPPPTSAAPTDIAELPSPRDHLDRILSQSLYHRWQLRQQREQQGESMRLQMQWLQRWADNARDWLDRWFHRSRRDRDPVESSSGSAWGGIGSVVGVLAWAVAAALVALLLVMGYRMFRDARAVSRGSTTISRKKLEQAMRDGHALAAASPVWLAEADRLAGEKDLRLAFRAIYLALLSGLHSANRIDYRRNRTNWMYVRRYRGPDDHRQTFAALTHIFDNVWYGSHTAELDAFDRIKRNVTQLLAEASPDHA
ncbi:MAG: DUF4129 domain-containing protein [Phycisphaeraceae bacterium]